MKLKAFDKSRKQYIHQADFAVTGDGHILIAKDTVPSLLLYPPDYPTETVFVPSEDVPDSSVEVTVEESD